VEIGKAAWGGGLGLKWQGGKGGGESSRGEKSTRYVLQGGGKGKKGGGRSHKQNTLQRGGKASGFDQTKKRLLINEEGSNV